jgi:23S rRNA (guanosine2251-2'-O)-methyltransferase
MRGSGPPSRPWVDRRPVQGLRPPLARTYPSVQPRPDLLDAEVDELVAGRRPVEEAFVARREARRLLVVPQRRQALEKLVLHATSLRIPIVEVEGGTLTALAGFDGHQGIALVVAPRRYAEADDILARSIERGEPPFILVLDSLEDPQNVGSLLRSAEAAGTHGVIFPTRHQAPLTPSAVKASAGAVEHLLLAPVNDLAGALADLHIRGLRIVGADAEASLTVREADLRGPLALVVGSEGQGLGPAVRRRCDLLVRIPMRGAVGSLNASVAGSILLYEATTQRGGAVEARVESPAVVVLPSAEEGTPQAGVASPPVDPDSGADEAPPPDLSVPVTRAKKPSKASARKTTPASTSVRKATPPEGSASDPHSARPGRQRAGSTVAADEPADALLPDAAGASPAPARPRKRRSASPSDPPAERG